MFSLRPYQVEAKQAVLNEWDKGQRKTLLVLPTGCHALGEKLLMADGTVRSVENINIGDKLLGADGNPRTVLYKHTGNDLLYRIKPENGEPFSVTGDHKLTLVSIKNSFRKTEEISDITVSKWLSWTEDRRAKYMLIRSESIAEFPLANKEILRIYPYFMGIFLSDKRFESLKQGSRNTYLYNQIEYYGLAYSTNTSKYIPHQYKTAPISQRLEVIAGLLDQDGYLGDDCYYFETKSRSMAEDIEFMCRSVGLAANVIGCYKGLEHFFKIQIYGDCSIIPCRTLRYKTSFLDCEKSAQRSHFIAYPAYKGDYIGFTVDGDNRYLMHDFTITHNCGKTVVFSSITEHQVNKGHRVLIMAHRGELLTQAADKLKAATGLDSVLEKAESSSLGSIFPVTVGSVQSLAQEKRLARFPNDYFQDIIVDEAHHCLSGTYQRVLEHFTQSNILGVTATPDRGDMKNLGEFFDSKAYEYSMIQAIRDGYLCPIKAQMIPLELDIKNVGISNGDYSAGDIGHALEPYLHQIAAEMKKCCQGRKTVVFLPLIAISQKFCKILNDIGFKAAEVNGGSDDRTQVLSDFENGKYDVLCNSMLLTEGWDCPSVDCIVVLRPTKNRSLYCLDESTEVLTKDGWKKDVNVGELVAAFNPSTSEITYVPALAKVRRPLFEDEYFCSAKGPSTDVRVTNHHRMIYDHKARHGWKIKEAEQIASFKSGCYLPVAGYGAFKGVPLTDAELRFIGWVMTDGHINKRNNAIIISQSSHHKEYCAEIEKCIIDCGFKFSRYIVPRRKVKWKQNGDNVVWTISKGKPRGRDKHLTGWGRLEKWISKDLSPELFEMTEEQFAVMLETIHHADGHKNPYVSYHITKGNKTFIERLQIMGIQRGYRASVVELPENAVRKHSVWTLHIKKQDYITVGDTAGDHTRWVKETHTDEMCWCVQNELGTLVTRRNGKVTIAGNCQIVGRGLRLHPGKEHLLLLDFLWMTTRHDLCKPSSLISKNDEIAEKIDKQIEDTGEVDLIEAEEQAERDVLSEREEALAEELRKLRTRKKQFVDPLQYALSIAAEDLATYTPTFDWEMKPPTQAQLSIISSRGVDTDCVTCAGYASMLIDKLIRRQEAGLSTPKQIRLLEKYGFREVGTWEFSQASNMISMLASHNWRLPNGLIPKAYKPN